MLPLAELINSVWPNPARAGNSERAAWTSLGTKTAGTVREQKTNQAMSGMAELCSARFPTAAADKPKLRRMKGCGEFRAPAARTVTLCKTGRPEESIFPNSSWRDRREKSTDFGRLAIAGSHSFLKLRLRVRRLLLPPADGPPGQQAAIKWSKSKAPGRPLRRLCLLRLPPRDRPAKHGFAWRRSFSGAKKHGGNPGAQAGIRRRHTGIE